MDVFFFYETQGTNPVMAILADTLMSMEVVWVARHIPSEISAALRYQKKTAQQWKNDFARYQGQHFPWVCPWYDHRDTIFSCGDFPNVPLMGSRGCIAYTPVIALRQLKWTQFVPDKELLGGVCFQYGTNNEQHERVRKAWEHIHKKGERELGRARAYASAEYLEWRNERRGDAIPVPMEKGKDRAMTEIESLRNQCKKKDELIERQRNECADANTRLAKRPRNVKEVENLSAEVKKLQDKVKTIEEETTKLRTEKEDLEVRGQEKDQVIEQLQEDLQQAQAEVQMIEQLQEELRQAQAEAESHKTLARDYSIELMKTKKNERLLEVQVKELKIERDYLQREIKKLELSRTTEGYMEGARRT
ncbi:hypothetical protein SESBI_11030 [Sesbania bispinosa]|nr:hypothetical protein SESBI_11030 [Sesbania bispinosa]